MSDDTIGIDISKATLDIHRLSDGKMMSFSNCTAGFKALSKFCAQTTVTRVVYEATGAYHGGLERALGAHLPLVKVNPLQARRFAQAQGVRAKTDAVDAKMLAVMGDAFALQPDEPTTKIQHDLKELRAFRSGLIKDRTRIMSRQKTQTLSITCRQSKARLAQVDKQISEIDTEVGRLINSSDTLAHSMKIIRSIPGIGAVCAATILIEMPEIGSMDRKQVHVPQCGPKTHSTVPTGQIRRNRQSPLLQAAKKVSPAVRVFAEPVHDTKNILVPVFISANNNQHTLTIIVQARIEVDTIGPDVDVALSREVALAPRFVLVPPSRLQPRNRGRGQSISIWPHKRSQCLAEVTCRDPLQIQPGQKLFDGFGLAQIGRHQRRAEPDL